MVANKSWVMLTNKRIIHITQGKKWGRSFSRIQDIDIDNIASFSSHTQLYNRLLLFILSILGFGTFGYGIYAIIQNIIVLRELGESAMLSSGVSFINPGLFLLLRSIGFAKGRREGHGISLIKLAMFVLGSLFFTTGVILITLSVWHPYYLLQMLQQGYFILAMTMPVVGTFLILLACKVKPYTSFEVHTKNMHQTDFCFKVIRSNTIFESMFYPNQRRKNPTAEDAPIMERMLVEIPALVRDIQKNGTIPQEPTNTESLFDADEIGELMNFYKNH